MNSALSAAADGCERNEAERSKRPRLLIVEDETLVALFLSDILAELNCDVCGVAASGSEALGIAGRERPTLALVDIGLQGSSDGVETAHALWERFGVPSVFMSGAADPALLERARQAEPLDFLQKPYSAAQLGAVLERVLCDG
jgi:CheY-like chemotaxis protein